MRDWQVVWLGLLSAGCGLGAERLTHEAERAMPSARSALPDVVEGSRVGEAQREFVSGQPSILTPLETSETPLDWLIVGGGEDPFSNQISIAQDLVAARERLLPSAGLVLFAGGPGSPVSVLPTTAGQQPDAVFARVAEFFGGPGEAELLYQPTPLAVDGPAYAGAVLGALGQQLAAPVPRPLDVYMAGHGAPGDGPGEHHVALWGGWTLSVTDVADVLDAPDRIRPMRLLLSSCFGGGFADLIFQRADPAAGALRDVVDCGLFATTAVDEAAGCDPDPERARQSSYAIHFLHAMAGEDRDGSAFVAEEIDFNEDGTVDLLEARARARRDGRSIDVPTSTSEYWLRWTHRASPDVPRGSRESVSDTLYDEVFLVRSLGQLLDLPSRTEAEYALAVLEAELEDKSLAYEEAAAGTDEAYYRLRIALLERWPMLDRAWTEGWTDYVRKHADDIESLMSGGPLGEEYRTRRGASRALSSELEEQIVRAAMLRRLVRAHHTLDLASSLARRGGPDWERYLALRACEAAPLSR